MSGSGLPSSARLRLPDGRQLDYRIRASVRSNSLRLRLTAREGLVVTVPAGISLAELSEMVATKAAWVARHLPEYERMRQRIDAVASMRPTTLELRAVGERWEIDYRPEDRRSVLVRVFELRRLRLSGGVEDVSACQEALRRWLMRYARSVFEPWLAELARETGLGFSGLSVRNQRARWGSCSARGRISLNCKLLFLPPEQARYVMLHELCHRREPNHSHRFWDLLRHFEPDSDALHARMRDAWSMIPAWAERGASR
ncbi:M48 family metallopeptidase [Imhoffiella purpurea]|uniref:Putative zinc protease n=1 Tax=Imhoffiella purpurea TaxID=1249627 RepID=W9V1U2_9GAMM|nr:SprT family zinc-dependent metalloprotease [Imhoffiella purpurea]EXJ13448.1 putative zinc protease [Imhoffiella purpurea]